MTTIGITTHLNPSELVKRVSNNTLILILGQYASTSDNFPTEPVKINNSSDIQANFGGVSITNTSFKTLNGIVEHFIDRYPLNNVYMFCNKVGSVLMVTADAFITWFENNIRKICDLCSRYTDILIVVPYIEFDISTDSTKNYNTVIESIATHCRSLGDGQKAVVLGDCVAGDTTDYMIMLSSAAADYIYEIYSPDSSGQFIPQYNENLSLAALSELDKDNNIYLHGSLISAAMYAYNDSIFGGFPARSILNTDPQLTGKTGVIFSDTSKQNRVWGVPVQVFKTARFSYEKSAEYIVDKSINVLTTISNNAVRVYGLKLYSPTTTDARNKFDNRTRLMYHLVNYAHLNFEDIIGRPLTDAEQNGIKYAFGRHIDSMVASGACTGGYITFTSSEDDVENGKLVLSVYTDSTAPIVNVVFNIAYTNNV